MSKGYLDLPGGERTVLRRASVPAVLLGDLAASLHPDRDGLALVDLELAGGRVAGVAAAGPGPGVDLDRAQVWPAFVDLHTHLDKGHILPRAPNPDGTVYGAVRTVAADRERRWSADDVRRRFEFGLRAAYAHGTCAIRTHLDCEPPQAAITWPVFAELRAAWAGRVELQGVGKFPLELYLTPEGGRFAEQATKASPAAALTSRSASSNTAASLAPSPSSRGWAGRRRCRAARRPSTPSWPSRPAMRSRSTCTSTRAATRPPRPWRSSPAPPSATGCRVGWSAATAAASPSSRRRSLPR